MIAAKAVAAVLLAAGRSRRFGDADKLAAPLDGLPLGLHAAQTLAGLPFVAKVAVTRAGGPDFAAAGFACVVNHDPGAGQARSLALGVRAARRAGPRAILVALADMPFVASGHIEALLAAHAAGRAVASRNGAYRGPPALFDAALFDALEAGEGDRGGRNLLRDGILIDAPEGVLRDIDTLADLDALTLPPRLHPA